jgi:hypothetical protein
VTRKILDIEFIPIEPIHLLPHECLDFNEMFLAALAIQNRLKHMFDASVFDGLSTNAPNEFLMNFGLAEAVLYSLRLYDVVVKSLDDEELNTQSEEAIASVLSSLSYDGDAIGRVLPRFYFSLEAVRMGIIHKISDLQQQQQQLLQQYHGLKDTYLRDNFANVKSNACSVHFDRNLSDIVGLYASSGPGPGPRRLHFEYLRTLDSSEDSDSEDAEQEQELDQVEDAGKGGRSAGGLDSDSDSHSVSGGGGGGGEEGHGSVASPAAEEEAASQDVVSGGSGGSGGASHDIDAEDTDTDTDSDGDRDGDRDAAADLTDEEVDSLMSQDTFVADDNCFNEDGSRLEPALCYMLNQQKGLFDRARHRDQADSQQLDRRGALQAARAAGKQTVTVQPMSE